MGQIFDYSMSKTGGGGGGGLTIGSSITALLMITV